MKFRLFFILVSLGFTSLAYAGDSECQPQNFRFPLRKNAQVITSYYPALSARGAFVFIAGPEAEFQGSEEFIQNLCQRGFSVAAFNLSGRKITSTDYVRAAKFVSHHVKMSFPNLPLSVYAWSLGANVAVEVGRVSPTLFKNVILDSPLLSSKANQVIFSGQIRGIKIFACANDPRETKKSLKKISYGAKVFVTNGEDCGHRLATSPEVQSKLIDYIESDYKQLDHFWIKI